MTKLSPVQNKTIEEFWMNIDDYRKQLKFREWELLENKNDDTNVGGGKSNQTSDTTAKKAILLAEDTRYQHLKNIIVAIENVYESLDEEMKEFADIRYLSKESNYYEWEDIADEIGVSKAKAYKMRNRLMDLTAERLGWL